MAQKRVNPATGQIEELLPTGEWSQSAFDIGYKNLIEKGDTSIINSANIKPNPEIPYVSSEPQPIPNVPGLITTTDPNLTPPMVKTAAETEAQIASDKLKELNKSLVGESAYRTEQETTQDIAGLTKTKQDLTNQLNLLQAEEKQIPLSIQQEFTGRGVTAGGVAPIQTARLRDNAIRALGVSAMLNAAQGNLATANDLVDRAVKAKFDPIREEINVKTANLKLILESPDSTIADKNRAQAQIDIQNAKKKEADKKEAEQKEIWNTATTAAQNGADALTLQKIQQAKTKEEALQAAGRFYKKSLTESQTQVVEVGDRKLLINSATGQTIKDLGVATIKATEPLSILDIQRYNELYPEANVVAGDTQKTADSKVITAIAPRDYTDEELRTIGNANKTGNVSYEEAIKGINDDSTIQNKDKGKGIISEIYGKKTESQKYLGQTEITPISLIHGKGNFAGVSLDDEIKRLQEDNVKKGFPKNTGLREQLVLNEGFSVKEVDAQLTPIMSGIGNFINSIGNFLFGK